MAIVIYGQNLDKWVLALQIASVVVTLILCFVTYWMARASYKHIATTARIADRGWRPELLVELNDPTRTPYKHPLDKETGPVLKLLKLADLTNKGGSRAIHIVIETHVNSDPKPSFITRKSSQGKGFILYRKHNKTEELKFNVSADLMKDGECKIFYHVSVLYDDCEGKEYLRETVFCVTYFSGNPVGPMFVDGVYEWSKGKWVDIGVPEI